MQRPLVLAIALAIAVVSGCAAPTGERAQSLTKPDARENAEALADDARLPAPRVEEHTEEHTLDSAVAPITGQESARPTGAVPGPAREVKQLAASEVGFATAIAPKPSSQPATSAGMFAPAPAALAVAPMSSMPEVYREIANRERYADLRPNSVVKVAEQPVSTFSIDVDTGSYSNVRRMLHDGQLPPVDAVRTEEFINYFDYDYPTPGSREQPFSITTEIAPAPWDAQRHLLLIGLQGFAVDRSQLPPSNLVFLIDSSGSMQSEDKIGLLKQSFRLLVAQLRPQDRVAIVAYAGSAGLVLDSTPGSDRTRILEAIDRIDAGGSTNGGAGIELAYATATRHFIQDGVNRVVLATDGDFNVGTVSVDALKRMVEVRREGGVALTTLGFGRDNYNDELAEQLADLGNGNHAYIDTLDEGRKVLVEEMGGTLFTIAKDVKIQIEFNPATVSEYRLLGYENRSLRREDFDNDRVDAGEIGAGHDVTALYEITLAGTGTERIPALRYAQHAVQSKVAGDAELAFLKLRYKLPQASSSRLIEQPLLRSSIADRMPTRLAQTAGVAAFAELLRGGSQLNGWSWNELSGLLATPASWNDPEREGLRELVDVAARLSGAGRDTPVAIAR